MRCLPNTRIRSPRLFSQSVCARAGTRYATHLFLRGYGIQSLFVLLSPMIVLSKVYSNQGKYSPALPFFGVCPENSAPRRVVESLKFVLDPVMSLLKTMLSKFIHLHHSTNSGRGSYLSSTSEATHTDQTSYHLAVSN